MLDDDDEDFFCYVNGVARPSHNGSSNSYEIVPELNESSYLE